MCCFCDDFLRWLSTKVGSEMRVFQDLLTHLNRVRVLTQSKDRISVMRSPGMNAGGDGEVD